MSRAKGSARRLLVEPGYHIRSKYDLPHLRARKTDSAGKDSNVVLPLTSMIDMFSMLVIFLLLNFSSTGEAYFIAKDVKLPEASNPIPMESLPLISITKDSVIFDAQKVGDNPLHVEETDQELPQLRAALQRIQDFHNRLEPGKPFKAGVNIQADRSTPVIYIKRVMNALISEGWTVINFVVRKPEGTE
ncbi:MAG: biopolymer transporter ExbD [Pseudobdellovibrionaceae bacterium]|nr:biopolymer transporter ExbD [Bdellovibrionales bacterium]USN47789.1 MAG: biopolymer transporter ExbD [Pseudobdellovibrionaceae bacterium]